MNKLTDQLSRMLTPEEMIDVERRHRHELSIQNDSIRALPPDPDSDQMFAEIDFDGSDAGLSMDNFFKMAGMVKSKYPPLESLPCANVDVRKYKACPKPGRMACSACKLVSYCSKECQKTHWLRHKRDCKNPMKSDNWRPSPTRVPFILQNDWNEVAFGLALWGNMPALDVINLTSNEKDATHDFSLAFVASGDLRNVVRTVNALPSNYSGRLTILLNDGTLPVVSRNLALLLILGTISDEVTAANIALHFWYSVFMPGEYKFRLSAILVPYLQHIIKNDASAFPLNHSSTLSWAIRTPRQVADIFRHYISESTFPIDDIQKEYDRVKTAPARSGYRDQMYTGLKPSHRVAIEQFRRFGIVLPFGAVNAHFNTPNLSLFSLSGKWFQNDYADPLQGWNIEEVIKAGKAHGATPEDIYGCLYFFLSDELHEFARRLRRFPISFHVYCDDASDLSRFLRDGAYFEAGYGLPPSIRFDRIEVSNILDHTYVGMHGVLTSWAPLLRESLNAALVGYFMNWTQIQEDGDGRKTSDKHVKKAMASALSDRLKIDNRKMDLYTIGSLTLDANAFYENSKPFMKYLKKQGLDNGLCCAMLKLRKKHTIAPYRIKVPLNKPFEAMPEFDNDDARYYWTRLYSFTWTERFVEFTRST